MKRVLWFVLVSSLLACASSPEPAPDVARAPQMPEPADDEVTEDDGTNADVMKVAELLKGRFDSSQQSNAQKNYFNIHLTTCAVEAPEVGAVVLYVEQAAASKLDAPYRQRLYWIKGNTEGGVTSVIYALKDPGAAVGLCQREKRPVFTPDMLELREGCEVHLTRDAQRLDHFNGATRGKGCASSLRGSSYATSEVLLTPDGIDSWDRGFDAGDQQVWGAEDGPYLFRRLEP